MCDSETENKTSIGAILPVYTQVFSVLSANKF